MVQRLITSAVGLIIFFCVLPASPVIFSIAVLLVTLLAAYEVNNAVTKLNILKLIGVLSSALIFAGQHYSYLAESIIAVFVIYLFVSVIMYGREKIQNIYVSAFATVVFSVFLSTLAIIKRDYTAYAVFLPFLFAWVTDSGAYFAGRFLGKHKLAPVLSPKKTIEGAVGGVIACVIGALIYVAVLENIFDFAIFTGNNYIKMLIIAFPASVVSQFGDLASSAIKRDYGIKDFGNLLPGHGGVMDRFDSVIFVSPFVFYLLTLL